MAKTYHQLGIFEAIGSATQAKAVVSPSAAPEQSTTVGESCSGWLERYKVVRAQREYWYWRYCWREADGKIHHRHVTNYRYYAIAYLIGERRAIAEIRAYLKRPSGLD
jgi:hypothetical protein